MGGLLHPIRLTNNLNLRAKCSPVHQNQDEIMSKKRLTLAPNMKGQDMTGEQETVIYIGSQAWDFANAPRKARSIEEVELSDALGDTVSHIKPVVIDDRTLQEIEQKRIAPEKARSVRVCRANNGQPLPNDRFYALYLNLAENNLALQYAIFVDEAGQLLEDLMPYILRIREDKETKKIAELSADKNKSDSEKENDYREFFKTLHDNQKAKEFLFYSELQVHKHPQSKQFYIYDKNKWIAFDDDNFGENVATFLESKNIGYSARKIKNLIDVTRYMLKDTPEHNPDFLPFKNGILNKKTGELFPHSKDFFFTYCLEIDYDSDNQETPIFNKWLDFVSDGNIEKALHILAVFYMVLINGYDWQLFVELTGSGGTGKSTCLNICKMIAGENNAVGVTLKTLDDPKARDLIIGKSLLIAGDEEKYIGDGSILKKITGGDSVDFNPKHKKSFSQTVPAVFLMSNNEPILFTENNGGIERRRVLFKFDKIIPPEEKDNNIMQKLQNELAGIVNLLFATFKEPQEAKLLLEKQLRSQEALSVKLELDPLLDFAQEFETRAESERPAGLFMGVSVPVLDITQEIARNNIYGLYIYYCKVNGIQKPIGRRVFRKYFPTYLKRLGNETAFYTQERNGRTYTNVYLKNELATFSKWKG